MRGFFTRSKLVQVGVAVIEPDVEDFNRHVVSDVFHRDIAEVGEDPDPFFEFNQGYEVVVSEHGEGRMHWFDP